MVQKLEKTAPGVNAKRAVGHVEHSLKHKPANLCMKNNSCEAPHTAHILPTNSYHTRVHCNPSCQVVFSHTQLLIKKLSF